jgi:hypothetical protein
VQECTSEFCVEFRRERARRAAPEESLTQGRSLKVVEHLGGKTVQRKHKEIELLRIL